MAQKENWWNDVFKFSKSDLKKIIITVIGGLILTFLLYISEDFFTLFISTSENLITFIFFTQYVIPVWVIISFLILFIPLIAHFLYGIYTDQKNYHICEIDNFKEKISYTGYKTDVFDSVKWIWSWYGENVVDLQPLCPKCLIELELVHSNYFDTIDRISLDGTFPDEFKEFSTYTYCPKNHFKFTWFDKRAENIIDDVKREIRRKKRTGEYKEAIEKHG